MANYKITIEKLDPNLPAENKVYECDEMVVIAIAQAKKGIESEVVAMSSVENVADVIAEDVILRAAGRLAAAKYDAAAEIQQAEMRESIKRIFE